MTIFQKNTDFKYSNNIQIIFKFGTDKLSFSYNSPQTGVHCFVHRYFQRNTLKNSAEYSFPPLQCSSFLAKLINKVQKICIYTFERKFLSITFDKIIGCRCIHGGLLGSTWGYWAPRGANGLHRGLLGSTGGYWAPRGAIGLSRKHPHTNS